MTNQKQLRSSRSKSRGRSNPREPPTTTPNATVHSSAEAGGCSPSRDAALPSGVNNTEEGKGRSPPDHVSTISDNSISESNTSTIVTETGKAVKPSQALNVSLANKTDSGVSLEVSDNIASPSPPAPEDGNSTQINSDLIKKDPGKVLLLVLAELRDIKSQMVKLNHMESTTASLVEQLAQNTSDLGEVVQTASHNRSDIQALNTDLKSLTDKVETHSSQLVQLQGLKEEISESSAQTVAQMNELIDTQRDQVDSFNSGTKLLQKDWSKEVLMEVDRKFERLEKLRHFQSLKDQAFRNRLNLIILGLPEQSDKTASQTLQQFFSEVLGIKDAQFKSALRLGRQPATESNYNRPILTRFGNWADRDLIWTKRTDIPDNQVKKIRIQADLPKELRDGIPSLYKVANAASKLRDYENARVHDYQLELNGKAFQIFELEDLPTQLRPSSLAESKSDSHLVFFSRHSKLSNHHPSPFSVKGQKFATMEHFLATRRAELSGKDELIKKAREALDPVQAKYVLNTLHGDHQQEWDDSVEGIAKEGLRAKFSQNPPLQEHLRSTGKLVLGEASDNAKWGIGMDFSNKEALDHTKWSTEGNLLGRALMAVRAELFKKKKKNKH